LTARVEVLLDVFADRYDLFLITDGQSRLQRAKFQALGLERWFESENVGISGDYGAEYQKPSTNILDKLVLTQSGVDPNRVVFFGDRVMDAEFAKNAGFHFVAVKCMQRRSQGAEEA
jgi:FMN phosphatase YigB (HAD superfamily)